MTIVILELKVKVIGQGQTSIVKVVRVSICYTRSIKDSFRVTQMALTSATATASVSHRELPNSTGTERDLGHFRLSYRPPGIVPCDFFRLLVF